MPLLAPVKDKRVLDVHQMSRDLDGDFNPKSMDFVHMFLTNRHVFFTYHDHSPNLKEIVLSRRFNTMSQGHDLIDTLADEMDLPPQALTERL